MLISKDDNEYIGSTMKSELLTEQFDVKFLLETIRIHDKQRQRKTVRLL